ncbi:B12-binding domain-containing radical SAM protein [Salisediminibacterium selenitireducens]|uniref:Radical SAM domain protein n=1 Tax=Bacillus selenitireducens (strain ATCC 700615 / DSM 15326 / MLS10) TaxID=439292 RepID=D6XT75_BACIE|nr:B12-binding domain-containing radical SAM protein [Salisediminibacterium selenitireducens]ADH99011.1 Radical SAM domain protein [[Bacillus] selenitireducens MLS10]
MTKTIVTTLNAKYIHMNLALRLLKAYCEPEHPVDIREYTIKDPDMNIVSDLYQEKPDVIGFSCYIWNIEKTLGVAAMLKKVLPDTLMIFGGPEVSFDTDYWMQEYAQIDMIVRSEGEETLKGILDTLKGKTADFSAIQGLSWRQERSVRHNSSRGNMDITTIPSPYRFQDDTADLGKRIVYFETSRGCPFRCQFCLSSIEQGVRYFPVEQVKADILYLIENGAKLIKFIDRTFNINRDYAMDMFRFLIDNHQGCQFQFEITGDIMRPEVLDYLNEHAPPGMFRFEIGVQSTNDHTNRIVERRQNFNKLSRTIQKIKEGGKIDQHLDLIAGLPEENYESFKQTFNDVFALHPEELQLGFLKMLRGTGMRQRAKEFNYAYMDHAPYEILKNNVLSFDDVIRIKRVEDILEKYWNRKQLDYTVPFLIRHAFDSPFDFFQLFGDYWDQQQYGAIGHQFTDLFTRLKAFLETQPFDKTLVNQAISLMKVDYLLHFKQKPHQLWWNQGQSKETLHASMDVLLQSQDATDNLPQDPKRLIKNGVFLDIPFSWDDYQSSNTLTEDDGFLYVYYGQHGPAIYSCSHRQTIHH